MIDRHLSPDDAVVAIRSFPRRFRSLFVPPDDEEREDPDEIARRYGPDGTSAAEHLQAADGLLAMLDRGIAQARSVHGETLHPTFAGLATATWEDDRTPIPSLLERFAATAERAAARVDAVPTDRWGDEVPIAGQAENRSLLDLVQEVVAIVADHLRRADRVLSQVR